MARVVYPNCGFLVTTMVEAKHADSTAATSQRQTFASQAAVRVTDDSQASRLGIRAHSSRFPSAHSADPGGELVSLRSGRVEITTGKT